MVALREVRLSPPASRDARREAERRVERLCDESLGFAEALLDAVLESGLVPAVVGGESEDDVAYAFEAAGGEFAVAHDWRMDDDGSTRWEPRLIIIRRS